MKTKKELLTEYVQIISETNKYSYYNIFFKLINGHDCFGIVESVNDNSIHFSPHWDGAWKDCSYEIFYNEGDEGDELEEEKSIQFIVIPLQDIDTNNLYYWNSQFDCFINPQWSHEQNCWIHNETIPGSIPLPTYYSEQKEEKEYLKNIGYWQSDEWNPYCPHPKHLVEPGWREDEREKIIAYLKAGHECGHWCGYSSCRFRCFTINPEKSKKLTHDEVAAIKSMGCRDFTDGEWVWPEGLAHYVEKHDICLPDAFIETMQKNAWIPPQVDFQHRSQVGTSSSYWIKWVINYVKTRGNASKLY